MFLLGIIKFYDIAVVWQCLFQDPATPIMENIIDLHHDILFFLIIIITLTSWIILRILFFFKHSLKNVKTKRFLFLTHHSVLEIIWTVVPTLVLGLIALPSYILIYSMNDIFSDPLLSIKIIGHQWYWSYEYAETPFMDLVKKGNSLESVNDFFFIAYKFDSYLINEKDLIFGDFRLLIVDNNIIVPILTTLRLLITSVDVIHSWTIPSLGVKMDAIPGRLNQISTTISRSSTFYGQCSELCGINHSFMPIALESSEIGNYYNTLERLIIKN